MQKALQSEKYFHPYRDIVDRVALIFDTRHATSKMELDLLSLKISLPTLFRGWRESRNGKQHTNVCPAVRDREEASLFPNPQNGRFTWAISIPFQERYNGLTYISEIATISCYTAQ
jgi:hypothetical protein